MKSTPVNLMIVSVAVSGLVLLGIFSLIVGLFG